MNVSESFLIYMCAMHEYGEPETNITEPAPTDSPDDCLEENDSL